MGSPPRLRDAAGSLPSAPRRRLSAADRREAILQAALDVFAESGFEGASLEDVATRGGVSKALIYEHFDSKRDLQLALLDAYIHEMLERVVVPVATAGPREDRLRAGVEAFLAFVEERPAAWRLISRNVGDPAAAEAVARLQEDAAGAVAAVMADDAPPPQEGDLELEQTVAVFAHLLSGGLQFLGSWWVDHPEIPRDALVEVVMDFAWIGLDRLAGGERWNR